MPLGHASFFVLLLFLASVIALSLARRRHLSSRTLSLFRALFPSWRFFEDLGHAPQVAYRLSGDGESFGPWVSCLGKCERRWYSVVLNSEGNLLHACNSLVEQLDQDIEALDEADADELGRSVSYLLTERLVRERILKDRPDARGARFQFRLNAILQGSPDQAFEDLMVSRVHEV
jgi:hypothetical protein